MFTVPDVSLTQSSLLLHILMQLQPVTLATPDACRGAFMGSAPSDGPSEAGSAEATSNSTAYNTTLKPLKPSVPNPAGDMLPAEAILEQFDRAQQYVLKNRGEFTAEQQDKLQVRLQLWLPKN